VPSETFKEQLDLLCASRANHPSWLGSSKKFNMFWIKTPTNSKH
jgi:hypothetical protein